MGKSALKISQIEMILKERHSMSVRKLSDTLQVSEMTIHRDLGALTNNNPFIRNIRRLLIYDTSQSLTSGTYDIISAKDANLSNKVIIGQKAASIVGDDDVIIIDLGSTTEHLAHALSTSLNVAVTCVSYNVLLPLINKGNLRVHYPGGFFHVDIQMFESTGSLSFLKDIRTKKLSASTADIHRNLGVACANSYEAATKKALLQASIEHILLADSSRFDQIETTFISEIENYHTVITDSGLTEEWGEYSNEKGITVIKV